MVFDVKQMRELRYSRMRWEMDEQKRQILPPIDRAFVRLLFTATATTTTKTGQLQNEIEEHKSNESAKWKSPHLFASDSEYDAKERKWKCVCVKAKQRERKGEEENKKLRWKKCNLYRSKTNVSCAFLLYNVSNNVQRLKDFHHSFFAFHPSFSLSLSLPLLFIVSCFFASRLLHTLLLCSVLFSILMENTQWYHTGLRFTSGNGTLLL